MRLFSGKGSAWLLLAGGAAAAVAVACGGQSMPVVRVTPHVPTSCQVLRDARAFRYTFEYSIESPRPVNPPDTGQEEESPFILPLDAEDFVFGQEIEGSIVNPDAADVIVRTPDVEGELLLVVIGARQWVNLGVDWIAVDEPGSIPFPPLDVCGAIVDELVLTGVRASEEELNGKDALRYTFDEARIDAASRVFTGQGGVLTEFIDTYFVEVWLDANTGAPLRLEASAAGAYPNGRELNVELMLEIRDLNDGGISVEPPI